MPTINPSLVPSKAPGTLFDALTTDTTLDIRWLVPTDPAYYGILNRPLADIALRQLILAKAIDTQQAIIGSRTLFPFLVQPVIVSNSDQLDVPIGWIWDIHVSMPKKWENLRLAKIKRLAGDNSTTDGYTGTLRLVFTATVENSSSETAVFTVDYEIDSDLTYQRNRIVVATDNEETVVINEGESETISGFVVFKTLSVDSSTTTDFLDLLAPPTDTTDSDSDGYFDAPAEYELADTVAGGPSVTDDYSTSVVSHGTGLLTDSAMNSIPNLDSDTQSWITSFNYPFDSNANRTSSDSITLPAGLFKEFNIVAPAGDQPTDDTSGLYFPVWISKIEKVSTDSIRLIFATYNTTETETGGDPSTEAVEFAALDLSEGQLEDEIVAITPIDDLKLESGTNNEFGQHFGRGHVVLSSVWSATSTDIAELFEAVALLANDSTEFSLTSTRISSFGISRVPKYTPTIGQSRALLGSTSRLDTPVAPSGDNRYVCELDQGDGNQIDLEAEDGITPHVAIDRYGYSGALAHKCIRLVVDSTNVGNSTTFYDNELLPRLIILLGRDPIFGDVWFNGTRFLTYSGDSWIG